MQHCLSASQFDQKRLLEIISHATEMETILKHGGTDMAKRKILAALFYEPSTRTRLSFESAMLRLGGQVISETDVHFSSLTKGENLADTIKIIGGYSDIIAIRSKNIGDAAFAAQHSPVPILNGGDGAGEHPTQALLDLFTIYKKFPEKFNQDRLKISFVGDLKYGRTVHSLCTILRKMSGFELSFVAPDELQLPEKYRQNEDHFSNDLSDEVLKNSDIIYDTRIQKERFEDPKVYEKFREIFIFDAEKVSKMNDSAILMHPLPRVNEITMDVDALPQAGYFDQAKNGVPIRMALIADALGLL